MTYEWDPEKARANFKKHRFDFGEATTVFLDPLAITFPDLGHSAAEHRELTIDCTIKGRCAFVSHCKRKGRIPIVSARPATRHERKQYEEGIG